MKWRYCRFPNGRWRNPSHISPTNSPTPQHNNEEPFKPFNNHTAIPITRKTHSIHTHDLTKIYTSRYWSNRYKSSSNQIRALVETVTQRRQGTSPRPGNVTVDTPRVDDWWLTIEDWRLRTDEWHLSPAIRIYRLKFPRITNIVMLM